MSKDTTLGCRLNAYESDVMRDLANKSGLKDAIIINTCAVTNSATRDSRAAVRKAARENKGKPIVVTGCASEMDKAEFAALKGVTKIIPNSEKLSPAAWGLDDKDIAKTFGQPRVRPIVQIQGGCDHECTFCVTTIARGAASSISIDKVCKQVQNLVDGGAFEVVLSGVDIASWGADLKETDNLGVLVKSVLKNVPRLGRIRLSSIDPAAIDRDLWHLIENEPRLCPHLHLSIQSGDDMILKRMKRRHKRDDILKIAARARAARPDIAICADLIAGFPTEDDKMFENTYNLIKKAGLSSCHIFAYSPRPQTAAAKMPQVPADVRKRRAAALRSKSDQQTHIFMQSQIGKTAQVVVESDGLGRTQHFMLLKLDKELPSGSIAQIKIDSGMVGAVL